MRKIGLVGGLGPESTVDYYREVISGYRARTGGKAPEMVIYSLNLQDFPPVSQKEKVVQWLMGAIRALHLAGADFALVTANTPHIVFDELSASSPIPLLSIVEETCRVVKEKHVDKVGLLGTKVTMSSDFYPRKFSYHDVAIIVPTSEEQDYIDKKITSEIIYNRIYEQTRRGLLKIIERMVGDDGIEGLILGCTELPLILTEDAFGIPFFNTTKIHAESAVRFCLTGK
jgi:aspartate racemase